MRAAWSVALLALACRYDLDSNDVPRVCESRPDIPACAGAVGQSDFAWLEENILRPNCGGRTCHGTPDGDEIPDGRLLLSRGNAYPVLMGANGEGVFSEFDPSHKLVVPFDAESSYLYFLMRGTPAASVDPPFVPPPEAYGYMPLNSRTLCCEKLEAVRRWIEAGALPPPAQ